MIFITIKDFHAAYNHIQTIAYIQIKLTYNKSDQEMKTKKQELTGESKQAQIFKLLTHPVRIAILQILGKEEACVCHLEAALGFKQAYLSQQLAVLREGGLISDRKDGWNVYYRLEDRQILLIIDSMRLMTNESTDNLQESPEACPCPKCNPVN